jgi:hypothetical protein
LQRTTAGCSILLELLRCGTSSEDGASDIFGFLVAAVFRAIGRHAAAARLLDGDPRRRGDIVHHFDGNTRESSVILSVVADVARAPHRVFLRGDESGA